MGLIEPGPLRGWEIVRSPEREKTARGAWLEVLFHLGRGELKQALAILDWQPEPGVAFAEVLARAVTELPEQLRALLTPPSPSQLHQEAFKALAKLCRCGHTSRDHSTADEACKSLDCPCKAFDPAPPRGTPAEPLPERYGGPSELEKLQGEFDQAVDEIADREARAWPFASPEEVVRPYVQRAKDRRPAIPRHKPEKGDPACVVCGAPCYSRLDPQREAEPCRKKTVGSTKRAHERCYLAAKAYGDQHGW